MKDLVIIGAGDFGREMAALVERINSVLPTWNLMGFLDDNKPAGTDIDNYSVLGKVDWLNEHESVHAVCSIGTGTTRKSVIKSINKNIEFATLIDPAAVIFKDCSIGEGSVICAGTILAINTKVGNHVIVNLSCTLGHDDIVDDFCTINPGVNISGKVHLSECVDAGTGSKIIQGKNICEEVTLGAGSVVVKDIEIKGTYVGIPAKIIST